MLSSPTLKIFSKAAYHWKHLLMMWAALLWYVVKYIEFLKDRVTAHCQILNDCICRLWQWLYSVTDTFKVPGFIGVSGLVHMTKFLSKKQQDTFSSRKLSRNSTSQKESKFSISSTGVSNWLVQFLDRLVSDEKLERVYAKKPALAQNKVWDGSKSSICNGDNTFLKL